MHPFVCVTIVTHNSRRYIARCLDSVLGQAGPAFEVVVVDNASEDGTPAILARYQERIRVIRNRRNLGFAAAQNQAITASDSDWVLALNPDVLLLPGFIEQMVAAGEMDTKVGSVCGRLLAIGDSFTPLPCPLLDSTGIYFTPEMRHFDRGWHEPEDGNYQQMEYVFGTTAAAGLYRRAMIADVSLEDGFLDPDFFTYREDADVAWRAQLLGWRCLYTPYAMAYHVRRMVPGGRRRMPAVLNMHSVKNRFLMRIKNMTGPLYRRHWLRTTLRDLVVIGGCFVCEPTSLPAFWHLGKCLRRALRKRRQIMRRRRASDPDLARWFSPSPAAYAASATLLRLTLDRPQV